MAAEHKNDEIIKVYQDMKKKIPNLIFLIERSKNKNVVVYEGILTAPGKLNAEKPVDVYWQDIDPAYVAANRKAGKMDDRSDLNMIESQFAYGVSTKPAAKAGEYEVHLVALPDRACVELLDDKGLPQIRITLNGKQCYLVRVYVHSVERWLNPMPKVEYVDISGYDIATGQLVTERVIPK